MPPTEPEGKSFAFIVNPLLNQFDFIGLFMGFSFCRYFGLILEETAFLFDTSNISYKSFLGVTQKLKLSQH